jgi:glycosyltransferase involved in cell wall biosynthesis
MCLFCLRLRKILESLRRKRSRRCANDLSEEVAISDDIRRYGAGLVVKRDVTEVAGAINDLLSDKERAATIARKGLRLAEERYSPKAVGKALRELYQKIIVRPKER